VADFKTVEARCYSNGVTAGFGLCVHCTMNRRVFQVFLKPENAPNFQTSHSLVVIGKKVILL